jgi:hypothetical protein
VFVSKVCEFYPFVLSVNIFFGMTLVPYYVAFV